MYSPKIPDSYIPHLYRLGRAKGRPMTHLVAEAVRHYLAREGVAVDDAHTRRPGAEAA